MVTSPKFRTAAVAAALLTAGACSASAKNPMVGGRRPTSVKFTIAFRLLRRAKHKPLVSLYFPDWHDFCLFSDNWQGALA